MGQRKGWTHTLWLGALAVALAWASPTPVQAQDVFFTQSGGRGLQNAKMSARVSKVEKDVVDVQTELAKVQPFAKTPIISCTNTGDKLRWTGNDWLCDSETDPTVQAFAKKALPSCGSGQILSASGSEFNCVNSGFLSAETDPTVQGFAKSPLPNCGTGEVLKTSGDSLSCATDERGLTQETDPYVHSFARTDMATIQNCEAGKVLTMQGSRLVCVFDAVGITVETDPTVQGFAKNDIPGYSLAACAAGEVLTAATQSGVTILKCESGSTVVGPVISSTKLDELQDVVASSPSGDDVLRFDGTNWVNSSDKIGALTNARWCYFDNTNIVCDRAVPAPQPASACPAGQMITWDNTGKVWTCGSLSGAISETLVLDNLADVSITTPVTGQGLTYVGTGWANGYNYRIANYDTDMRVVDSSGGNGAAQIVVDGTALLTAIGTQVGIRTSNPNADLDVLGTISATNLNASGWLNGAILQTSSYVSAGSIHTSGTLKVSNTTYTDNLRVNGNTILGNDVYVLGGLYVSGSQTIDGVVFANGGVSATGTISATRFVGDGSGLTGIAGGDIIISGTTFVEVTEDESITFVTAGSQRAVIGTNGNVGINTAKPNAELEVNGEISATNLRLSGNLYVSGSQTIDGVVFANGGISATGSVSATAFSGDGSALTNVNAASVNWDNIVSIPNQVQEVSRSGAIVMAGISSTNVSVTNNLTAVQIAAGTGLFTTVNASSYVNAGALYTSGSTLVSNTLRADVLRSIGNTYVGNDLYIAGGLFVSGSQTIDGVIFANGGVSATGAISATNFYGDGSGLTGVTASSMDWYGLTRVPAQVVAVSDGTAIQMAGISSTNVSVTNNLTAAQIAAGTGTFTNVLANAGSFGNVNATGYVSAGSINTSGTARVSNSLYADALNSVGDTRVGNDLYVRGNLYVSGSQSIDGVTFANGGVSATGTVTATSFSGDGSGLTGVAGDWYDLLRIPSQVVAVSDSTAIQMTGISSTNVSVTNNLTANNVAATNGTFTNVAATMGTFGTVSATAVNGLYISGTQGYFPVATITSLGAGSIAANTLSSSLVSATNISATLVDATREGTVSGTYGYFRNISGTSIYGTFTGDGSGLTGVVAGSSDRIVSGSTGGTRMVAISDTGYISVTQAGANSAWFDPTRGLVTLGVSATGGISGSTGYFSGNVGVGTTNPSAKLDVNGTINATGLAITGNQTLTGTLTGPSLVSSTYGGIVSATYGYFRYVSGTYLSGDGSGITNISANAITGLNLDRIVSGTANAIAHQNAGVSVSVPLDVAGPVKVAGSGSEGCATGAFGTIRLNPSTGALQVCRQ